MGYTYNYAGVENFVILYYYDFVSTYPYSADVMSKFSKEVSDKFCDYMIKDVEITINNVIVSDHKNTQLSAIKALIEQNCTTLCSVLEKDAANLKGNFYATHYAPGNAVPTIEAKSRDTLISIIQSTVVDPIVSYFAKLDNSYIISAYQIKPPEDYSKDDETNNGNAGGSGDDPLGSNESTTTVDSILSTDESEVYTDAEFTMLKRNYKKRKTESDISKSKIDNLRHVFGMPYQFLPETDARYGSYASSAGKSETINSELYSDTSYMGHKYIERIAQRANILYITPGSPRFLKGATRQTKEAVLKSMTGIIAGELNPREASAFLDDEGSLRYYSFDEDVSTYYKYLNPALRAAARYLNLHDERVSESDPTLDKFNYYEYFCAPGTEGYNAYRALTFYVDGLNNSSDSITNNIGESSFVDTYDQQITGTAQEIITLAGKAGQDLLGTDFISKMGDNENVNSAVREIDEFVEKFLGGNAFLKKLGIGAKVMLSGGHIIFPKIWRDSEFRNESFTLNFKFVSPDNDDESIFWNVLAPMLAWVCLGAPRGFDEMDAYGAPFCVRAFCQSMFHIEMGYITNINITKGAEGMWTASGLPTCIEVSVTIEDLYNNIYISSGEKDYNFSWWNIVQNVKEVTRKTPFLKNTAMLNWIANSCGVNINKPDILRDIDMYFTHVYITPVLDLIPNFSLSLFDLLRNWSTSLYTIFGKMS